VNSPFPVDIAFATFNDSTVLAYELFGEVQESEVTLCQAVVAHPVFPTVAEGLALTLAKLTPSIVNDALPLPGILNGYTADNAGVSKLKTAAVCPSTVLTLDVTTMPKPRPTEVLQTTVVELVHVEVEQRLPPTSSEGVASSVPKFNPEMVIVAPPVVGEFGLT